MTVNLRTIDELKIAGHFFAAGALAFEMKQQRNYGCHFGMRSTRDADRDAFNLGWDAAATAANRFKR